GHGLGGARMKRQELLFEQPRELSASTPVEMEKGGDRDAVRLLVTTPSGHQHVTFADLPRFLSAGDLLVANESATLAASLEAHGPSGPYTLDLSTRYAEGLWLAEPRWDPAHPGPMPIEAGEEARVGDATARYVAPYPGIPRLWFIPADQPHSRRRTPRHRHRDHRRPRARVGLDAGRGATATRIHPSLRPSGKSRPIGRRIADGLPRPRHEPPRDARGVDRATAGLGGVP